MKITIAMFVASLLLTIVACNSNPAGLSDDELAAVCESYDLGHRMAGNVAAASDQQIGFEADWRSGLVIVSGGKINAEEAQELSNYCRTLSLSESEAEAATSVSDNPLAQPPGGPPVSLVVSNSDLAVGSNRVSFGLVDREYMPVRPAAVAIRAVYYEPAAASGQVRHRTQAEFLAWPPEGRRGVFVADVAFDQAGTATGDTPGIWELHATFDYAAAPSTTPTPLTIGAVVSVASEHSVPFIGDAPPLSNTPTAANTGDLRTISSSPQADPALYQVSVAEAVRAGKPAIISFATPSFCVSATCGPQIADLSALAARYGDQANFVHVEVYRDPHRIDPGSPTRELVPAVNEWGLVSEPWTFVIGSDGRISERFEQYVPPKILEEALLSAMNQ